MKARAFAAVLVSTSLIACSGITDRFSEVSEDNSNSIISIRPQKQDHVFAILKLSVPALLTVSKNQDGVTVVDQEAKDMLEEEQQLVISSLKQMSDEVKVIYRYRYVLNAVAVVVPYKMKGLIEELQGVSQVEVSANLGRPQTVAVPAPTGEPVDLSKKNSVTFIGADKVHKQLEVDGAGMSVGVIDTGLDYTHTMLGGVGDPEAYKSIDPSGEAVGFPNKKVVGGIDLVGSSYNPSAESLQYKLPKPDGNPLDEAGHGTHVAGSIAGIGDTVKTYSGVAPKAQLHAIKVFGARGSTSDMAVIAGLDYAADPDKNGDLADQLDVVNLSLGSDFGAPHLLYKEAVSNLVSGGTVVVASAGNSGPTDFIVGAPSTVEEALSVAASIDNMSHNISFDAVAFHTPSNGRMLAKAIEGPVSKPIKMAPGVKGPLVYIGLGKDELTDEQKAALKGNVAFIDRGEIPFFQKLSIAVKYGAIGAVVANNQPGQPIPMGGQDPSQTVDIPAIMISMDLAEQLKADMTAGPVSIEFTTNQVIDRPELIDNLTSFSSKGPRSLDSIIKPEISGPGQNIISAAMGKGSEGVQLSGTSMSGPHLAGVMALLKQYRPELSPLELKSLVLSTGKRIANDKGEEYPVSQQGSGRVQAYRAAVQPLVFDPPTLSLGNVRVASKKAIRKVVQVKNTSTESMTLTVEPQVNSKMKVLTVSNLNIPARETRPVTVTAVITAPTTEQVFEEYDGYIVFKSEGETVAHIPLLAVTSSISQVKAKNLTVFSTSKDDSSDAAVDLVLENKGQNAGMAFAFNLLGRDKRKALPSATERHRSRACDLQSAGYRVVEREIDGKKERMLQIATKLYNAVTGWHFCEVSVQIDANGDKLAEQELVGVPLAMIGISNPGFGTLLVDATQAREIRKDYEQEIANNKQANPPNYMPAMMDLQPMFAFQHSTLAIIEARLSALALRPSGELAIKVAVIHADDSAVESDDFLSNQVSKWKTIDASKGGMGYVDIPEAITLPAHSGPVTVPLAKGDGDENLVVYYPKNRAIDSMTRSDNQSQVVKPKYAF